MTFKPNHVALTVKNLQESVRWYQEKLGFSLINEYKKGEKEFSLLGLDLVRLELFCFGEETKPLPEDRRELMDDLKFVGTKHFAIEVENLEETVSKLKQKGVEFATEIDSAAFGGKYIFIRDCNGILIELYQS